MSDGQTDGRTDLQNYDSQDRASIAASWGNNVCLHVRIKLCDQVRGKVPSEAESFLVFESSMVGQNLHYYGRPA